ncbi:MAG: hypothetical protein PHO00_03090 [bacterium]|nr:hypothetical protein [bacterium]
MKKLCLFFVLPVALFGFFLWTVINWYFIPYKLLPSFEETLPLFLPEGIKINYEKIAFSPFTGFMICGFRVIADGSEILSAGELNIDLAILPLLRKKVIITDLSESDVEVNIRRDENGRWNISKLLDSDLLEEVSFDEWEFQVRRLSINTCRINFVDVYRAENSLKRRLEGITLKASSFDENIYHFEINSPADRTRKEDINVSVVYDQDKKTFSGRFKGKTKMLESYWDYYIDEFFSPWKMDTEEAGIEIEFLSCKQYITLKGSYNFGKITLQYGDLSYNGDIIVEQDFKHGKSDKTESYNKVDLILKNSRLITGETEIFEHAYCKVIFQNDIALVEDFRGEFFTEPAYFSGQVHLGKPRKINLRGKAFGMDNVFSMQMPDDNRANLKWKGNLSHSHFNVSAVSNDIKNMDFSANASGSLQLEDFSPAGNCSGSVKFELKAAGELDRLETLNGKGGASFRKININRVMIESGRTDILLSRGIGELKTNSVKFYSGHMGFLANVDLSEEPVKWGAELDLRGVDVAEFDKSVQTVERNSKGTLSGNIACVGLWAKKESVKGGGYFEIKDDILWEMPVFRETEEGIKEVSQNIEIPKLDNVSGNFHIENCKISTGNTYCRSKNMEIWINGWIDFSGYADMVVGVRFGREGIMRILSIPVNILAECIQVNIKGKYPEFKHKAEIKPIGWLLSFFPQNNKKADSKKYSLEKLRESGS